MTSLTPGQALKAARELKSDFGNHGTQALRRRIRQRKQPVDWKALGLEERVKDIAPLQADTPNQEAQRYANAINSAEPEVAVFVAESEKATRQKIGERLESFYDAMIPILLPDEYETCLRMVSEGVGARRLDLKPQFWGGIPERGDLEQEPYNSAVDDHRKGIGLPFECPDVDTLSFFYEEDKNRNITVGCEWGRRKVSVIEEAHAKASKKDAERFLGPVVPEGVAHSGRMVDYVVLRTPDVIYHAMMGGPDASRMDKVIWEGQNLFAPSTGYILWRGLPSGFPELDERYLPFIMNSLALAQQWNLFATLQANFAIRSLREWTEDAPGPATTSRLAGQVAAEAKGTGKAKRTSHGAIVAEMEAGRTVRWREVSGDLREHLLRLDTLEERYRFPEPLAPESSSGESGRDTIRRQEASSRLLGQGFESRKQSLEELVRVVRRTLFGHKDFLADGRMVYLPHLVEGLGDDGTLRKQDVISISEDDEIPHEVQVTVATSTQAAQLALNEEGIRMEGRLSRDTIDQDYYRVKNIPLENRRRQKDLIRASTYPETVKRAILAVNERLAARVPPGGDLIVPEQQNGGGSAGIPGPAVSGAPTPPQREDIGLNGGGGVVPLAEGG